MVKPAEKRFLWTPDGKRWYVRRKGKYHRIKAQPGTEDFDREYWAIRSGRVHALKTTWKALIESYMRSDRWAKLAPKSRRLYEGGLLYLIEKNGSRDVTRITRRDAIAMQEANRHRPSFARLTVIVMSVVIEHAIDLGYMRHNPIRGMRYLRVEDGRKRPHVPWPDEAIAKFRAEAAPFQRLVFEIGIGTVQRPSDWLRFTWGDYDGDSLKVVQGKTGVKLTLPCSDHLRAVLDAARPEHASDDAPIIMGRSGPLTYQAMADAMRAERERLGLMAYDLHALRYRGVMELAWAGCDDDEIAAFSGHNTKAMIIKYAGEARQIMRARTAREKRGRTEKAQS